MATTWITKDYPYYCGNCGKGKKPDQIKIGGLDRLYCGDCGKQVRLWPRKKSVDRQRASFTITNKMLVERVCPVCRRRFYVTQSNLNRGRGKYCCRECAGNGSVKSKLAFKSKVN
jgi:hypothetical protein